MGKKIEHQGIVESINGSHIRVKILQSSACSGCHAKSLCSAAESKEKIIDIYSAVSGRYTVGDRVKVCGSETMGRNAVILSFGLPLVLMVLWVVVGTYMLHINEQLLFVGIIVLLAMYYVIIHSFRNKLSKNFAFWIED